MFDNPEAAFFQGALNGSRGNVRKAVAELHQANANIDYLNAEMAKAWEKLRLLEAENARLAQAEATASMNLAGLIAQFDAFKAQHPASPLLADSGKLFKSGKTKTKVRLIFEAAFDAEGMKIKIVDPASYRLD